VAGCTEVHFRLHPLPGNGVLRQRFTCSFPYFVLPFPLFGMHGIGVYLELINHLIDVDRQLRARVIKMDFCLLGWWWSRIPLPPARDFLQPESELRQ
jgi:hypothetical protein